jgi:tRNA(Ile)-lysidine synthase
MPKQKQQLSLEQKVLDYIREQQIITGPQRVLVAVSGGPDSMCLLHILSQLQKELRISLHIAHLDHQLRGEASEADARFIAELALKWYIPATIEKRDVPGYQAEHGLSLEEAAREVRYLFLAQTAQKVGAECVAVGHTLNDQVETILLHIIRGTGARGLRGLQPQQVLDFSGLTIRVIRPLLAVSREDTESCCASLAITPCLDASNLSLVPLRNRVRLELLPLLKSYNPGIFESLLRTSRIARDDQAFLDEAGGEIWAKLAQKEETRLVFPREAFRSLAPALQRWLLRKGIEELLGTLKDIETRHIEIILEVLEKPAGRQVSLPGGLIFRIDYDRYLLGFEGSEPAPFPELAGVHHLPIPGETRLPGWTVKAVILAREQLSPDFAAEKADRFTAYFDLDKTGNALSVRARRRGDYFQPLGLNHLKKVGRFMLDARISRELRYRIPIFASPAQIIWVAGWRIDERVKVTANTQRVLSLEISRIN